MPGPGVNVSSEESGTSRGCASTATKLNRGTYSITAVSCRCALNRLPHTPSSSTSLSIQDERFCSPEIGTRTLNCPLSDSTCMAAVVSGQDVLSTEAKHTIPRIHTHLLSNCP